MQLSPLAFAGWLGLFITALNSARADDVGTFVFLIAGRGTPPLNDLTPLDTGRMVVG